MKKDIVQNPTNQNSSNKPEEKERQPWKRPYLQQLDLNLDTAAGATGLNDGMMGRS
ncbi:MAG: hypothetical protein KC433_24080 [Anaerolineales bacterium]|nr:hypothetical protein [Anaerolineales bacterium]MCB8937186.1 hypothetical protein [Ardenticatenaceae bacterium]